MTSTTPPRIDFYLLASIEEQDRLQLACRLTEKAWRQGYRICVLTEHPQTADRLDQLLWSYREDAFIPHARLPDQDAPVLITADAAALASQGGPERLLIRLSTAPPEHWQDFERVAELVGSGEADRATGRQHYRHYQTQGIRPHLHHLQG